jgi:hypothetical protein
MLENLYNFLMINNFLLFEKKKLKYNKKNLFTPIITKGVCSWSSLMPRRDGI